MSISEIIIINDEYYYKIPNGTSYVYKTIPKEFKPYFDKLQQENQKYKEVIDKAIEYIEKLNKIIPRFWFTKLLEILRR